MKALILLFVALFFLANHATLAQPARAIVIEDHTGAWCGWCVRGNQAAEDLHAEYGNQFIPLAFHNDDSMALPIQKTLATKFHIGGYPTGLVDREAFTFGSASSTNIDPDNWAAATKSLKDTKSNIGVSVNWSINNSTGILTATVTAEMFLDLNTQYAFNLAVVEDSVTGSGTGWDQTNYLSGRSGYESHPYYYLPSHVTNFYHMNVVRAFLGGENGDVGTFPAIAKKGSKYTCTFTVDLATLKIQHRENVWVAGMVVENGGLNRVVNAVADGKRPTPKSTLWKVEIQSENNYRQANRTDSTVYNLTLSNKNDKSITAIVDIDKVNSIAPDDWSVRFNPKQVEILPGESQHVQMIVKLGSKAGYGGFKVTTQIKPFDTIRSLPTSTNVGVLSDAVHYAIAKFDLDEGRDLEPLLESYRQLALYPDATAVIQCNDSTLSHYNYTDFDVLILPESYATRTSVIFSKKMVQMMQQRVDSYRPIIMTSPMDMWFTADNYGTVVSADVKKFFTETLGFTGAKRSWGPWLWNSSLKRSEVVGVRSFDGQSVASSMDFNVNETDSIYTIQDHWLDELSIIDSQRVHRILNFYGTKISDDSSVAAVWTDLKHTAMIYQGFGFEAIRDEPVRRTLLANYLAFLQQVTDVKPGDVNPAQLEVQPNPSSDLFRLRFSQHSATAVIRILDAQGREYQRLHKSMSDGTDILITTDTLCAGAYFVVIDDGGVYSLAPLQVVR